MGLNGNFERIIAPYDGQLRHPAFYIDRIWRPARQQPLSRRAWMEGFALVEDYAPFIRWPDGSHFKCPSLLEVCPDPENRWMSAFLKADASGERPASFIRNCKRLRFVYLYCVIQDLMVKNWSPYL